MDGLTKACIEGVQYKPYKNFLDRDPVMIISLNDIEFSSLLAQNKMPILKQYFLPKLIQLYC
ncbi:hypothetical protein Plhal304r1_c046g0127101 [Plasmopara halstedii]